MEGLYYAIEHGENTTLHLLRFYNDSQYVISKSIIGNDLKYFKRELLNFKMEGHVVKGEPEFTFCGAFSESGDAISFKVENELRDTSETWVHKDVLSFKGLITIENSLQLVQISKRTNIEIKRVYKQTSEEELLGKILV